MTVAASILDSVSSENIPVRVISNTTPEQFGENASDMEYAEDDPVGSRIFMSPPFKGRSHILAALRMLAQMELMISVPIEKMLDHMLANPHAYSAGGNIVFISAYLSERMINFAYAMRRLGIAVVFYITSTNLNVSLIPDDIEVHYKTFVED